MNNLRVGVSIGSKTFVCIFKFGVLDVCWALILHVWLVNRMRLKSYIGIPRRVGDEERNREQVQHPEWYYYIIVVAERCHVVLNLMTVDQVEHMNPLFATPNTHTYTDPEYSRKQFCHKLPRLLATVETSNSWICSFPTTTIFDRLLVLK